MVVTKLTFQIVFEQDKGVENNFSQKVLRKLYLNLFHFHSIWSVKISRGMKLVYDRE